MPDPRTDLYNVLSRRLTEEMVARDEAWADYWQRRRVVVVPDNPWPNDGGTMLREEAAAVIGGLVERCGDVVIRDCIARLKAARDKESTNRNLSTLLVVILKVQKDLETLLNGQRAD